MIVQTVLFVLLGIVLVSTSPVHQSQNYITESKFYPGVVESDVSGPRESYNEVPLDITAADLYDEVRARSIQESWSKLKESWNELVEVGKIKWNEIKEKSKITYEKIKKHVKVMKESGLKLLDDAQKTYDVFVREGKCIYSEVRELYDTVKNSYEELRKTSREAFAEYAELMDKLKKVVVVVEVIMKAKNAVG